MRTYKKNPALYRMRNPIKASRKRKIIFRWVALPGSSDEKLYAEASLRR